MSMHQEAAALPSPEIISGTKLLAEQNFKTIAYAFLDTSITTAYNRAAKTPDETVNCKSIGVSRQLSI